METTGLDPLNDRIIEVGMLRVKEDTVIDQFQSLVRIDQKIPKEISELTGITKEILEQKGIEEKELCSLINEFINKNMIVGYNIAFDIQFLEEMSNRTGIDIDIYKCKDILDISRRKIKGLKNYQLITVAKHLSVEESDKPHRALNDCYLTKRIFDELNKIE